LFDPTLCDPRLLDVVDEVTAELLAKASLLRPSEVMVVGAVCRDIMQSALGHQHVLRATNDVDVALTIVDWAHYGELISQLTPASDTGICFQVAGVKTDILPFGRVEDPTGTVQPPARREEMSVWAFQEVFDGSLELSLPRSGTIRIPTVPGYLALKMAAWLDRSAFGEDKDASDIAVALHWYTASVEVETLLYDTDHGNELLILAEADPDVACLAHG
jgi:predicted nucleotidyltransferase